MQKEKLKKEDSITSIEVHVTKTDEYINLGGFERAAVGKDKAADFFFSVHFNAATGEKAPEVFLDITKVSGTVDKSYRVYIHQLDKENFGGHYDKSAANYKNPARGPQMLIRGDFPTDIQSKCELISQNLKSEFSKFIYETEYGDNKGSFDSIGDSPEGTANVSPTYLGVTNPDAKKIIPIYLEADFINVESGDRLWNTKEYHQNIKACRARWKTPPEPNKNHEQWKKDNLLKVLPDLKADHDMFKLSAKKIAEVLFNNRHHRLCS